MDYFINIKNIIVYFISLFLCLMMQCYDIIIQRKLWMVTFDHECVCILTSESLVNELILD